MDFSRKRHAAECPVEGRLVRENRGALKSGLRGIEIMVAVGGFLKETNLFGTVAFDVTVDESEVYAAIVRKEDIGAAEERRIKARRNHHGWIAVGEEHFLDGIYYSGLHHTAGSAAGLIGIEPVIHREVDSERFAQFSGAGAAINRIGPGERGFAILGSSNAGGVGDVGIDGSSVRTETKIGRSPRGGIIQI